MINSDATTQHEPALPAPAILGRWWVWALLGAAFLIPFFLPIAQELRRHPIIGALGEQLHIPLLACLTLLIYWRGPLRGRLWWAAGTAAVLGAAIEFVQELVGRTALFADWILDLIGIGLVVGLVLWRGHGLQRGKYLIFALLFLIPAQLWMLPFSILGKYEARQVFPLLADFDGRYDKWLWKDTHRSLIRWAPADSNRGNVLRISGDETTNWPGARLVHFPEHWEDYTQLVIEARVVEAAGDSLRFGVRIDDFEGRKDNKWATKAWYATRQWQTFVMPIAERKVLHGERHLDLSDVESVLVFLLRPDDSFVLEVDNIRLR